MSSPSATKSAPPSKSARTRQRVLDAAAVCFKELGYATVTLADIAERAQMKAGSLYYHFDSKEALVEEVLRVGVERIHAETRAAVEKLGRGADPIERLRAAIGAHFAYVASENAYASANIRIFSQVPEPIRRRHLERHREYGAYWASLFRKAQASGRMRGDLDLSIVRMLVLGALNWSVEWYRDDGRTPAEIAEQLSRMLFEGLATSGTRRR